MDISPFLSRDIVPSCRSLTWSCNSLECPREPLPSYPATRKKAPNSLLPPRSLKYMSFSSPSNALKAETSSSNRIFAFFESFSGLLKSSLCSLSSFTSEWYGFFGKSRGESHRVSTAFPSATPAAFTASPTYFRSWSMILCPHTKSVPFRKPVKSATEFPWKHAPSSLTPPMSSTFPVFGSISVSMNAIRAISCRSSPLRPPTPCHYNHLTDKVRQKLRLSV